MDHMTEEMFDSLYKSAIRRLELRVLAATEGHRPEVALAALFSVATFYISEEPDPREAGALWGDTLKRVSASLKRGDSGHEGSLLRPV